MRSNKVQLLWRNPFVLYICLNDYGIKFGKLFGLIYFCSYYLRQSCIDTDLAKDIIEFELILFLSAVVLVPNVFFEYEFLGYPSG